LFLKGTPLEFYARVSCTRTRDNRLRLGPAPCLCDDQLRDEIRALSDTLRTLS
jgi:hypothetical protein